MISILCDKHKAEYREKMLAAGLPQEVSDRTTKGMPEAMIDSLVIRASRVRLDNQNCPDCGIVGLSKQGRIEKLDSPDDWIFS